MPNWNRFICGRITLDGRRVACRLADLPFLLDNIRSTVSNMCREEDINFLVRYLKKKKKMPRRYDRTMNSNNKFMHIVSFGFTI